MAQEAGKLSLVAYWQKVSFTCLLPHFLPSLTPGGYNYYIFFS
jgi:hypothetical protein